METEQVSVNSKGWVNFLFLSSFWIYFYGNVALEGILDSFMHDKWRLFFPYKALLCIKKSSFNFPEKIWLHFVCFVLVKVSLLLLLSFLVKSKPKFIPTGLFQEFCYLVYIVDLLYLLIYPAFILFGVNIDWYYASMINFFTLSALISVAPWLIFALFSSICLLIQHYFISLSVKGLLIRLSLAFASFLIYVAVIETYIVWLHIRF